MAINNPDQIRKGNFLRFAAHPRWCKAVHFSRVQMTLPLLHVLKKDPTCFDPVQPTGEIMNEFGFTHYNYDGEKNGYYIKGNYEPDKSPYFELHLKNGDLYIRFRPQLFGHGTMLSEIKYLHQIQNLYTALTGIELKPLCLI